MNAPGKSHREGISLIQLYDMFPDESTAEQWFENIYWPEGKRHCGKCGSANTYEVKNRKPVPYRCRDCKSYFSVRTGTALDGTNLPLRKWAIATYLYVTNLKGVSSMKLHRDLKVTQKTAWFMMHRLRTAWDQSGVDQFMGPVEVDETFIGGKRKNMSNAKRRQLAKEGADRGSVGKTAVVGAKDRSTGKVKAKVVQSTDKPTLHGFVADAADPDATVYTDEASAYAGLPNPHETVKHSVSEYVKGMAHTNGMESFWSMLKRGYMGTFHHFSARHLHRYVSEFAGRHNVRDDDTVAQMQSAFAGMVGKRLMYKDLIAREK